MCCFFKLIELRLIAIVHPHQRWGERLSRFGPPTNGGGGGEKCAAIFSKEADGARTEVRSPDSVSRIGAEEAKGIRIMCCAIEMEYK